MNPQSPEEIAESLFLDALDRPEEDRARFLDVRCNGDAALLAEVDSLLAHGRSAKDDFLVGQSIEELGITPDLNSDMLDSAARDGVGAGVRVGRYLIRRFLGQGGMGVVYEAVQDNPRRHVALKLLRYGQTVPAILRRFQREADLLGKLDHPAIARIFEAGVADHSNGPQPYLAMELVEGRSLDQWSVEQTVSDRLRLFVTVCDAVQHAHERGIIHRDLKPANIVVHQETKSSRPGSFGLKYTIENEFRATNTSFPKVLDFGIARLIDSDLSAATIRTGAGNFLGTVSYMSPEQVMGDPHHVDARSDIYSLGVILFEMLGRRLPLDVRHCSILEAVRIIREEEPTRLLSLDASLGRDLDTIVAKALEKDPHRRYSTAADLAADIQRVLGDRPILARPTSTLHKVRKFAKRNRGFAASILLIMMGLSMAAALSTHFAFSENRHRLFAEQQGHRANMLAASAALDDGNPIQARRILKRASSEDRTTFEWRLLTARLDTSDRQLRGHTAAVTAIDFSPDGQWLASASLDHSIRIWPMNADHEPTLLARHSESVREVEFSPDGRQLASCSDDGVIRWWDVTSGGALYQQKVEYPAIQIEFSPTSNMLASLHHDKIENSYGYATGRVRLWDAHSGELVAVWAVSQGQSTMSLAFSPQGDEIWLGIGSKLERRVPLTGERIAFQDAPHDISATCIASDGVGRHFATSSSDKLVALWSAADLTPMRSLRGHTGPVFAAAVSPDGRWVASGGQDETVRVWSTETDDDPHVLLGLSGVVRDVAVSPDSRWVAAGSDDATIRFWNLDRADLGQAARVLSGHTAAIYDFAFHPANDLVASAGGDGTLRLWSLSTPSTMRVVEGLPREIFRVAMSPDGHDVALGGWGLHLVDVATGDLKMVGELGGRANSLTHTPDGRRIAASACKSLGKKLNVPTTVTIWDALSGTELARRTIDGRSLVAAVGDRIRLAVFRSDGARMLDLDTGDLLFNFAGHNTIVERIRFAQDGSRFLCACHDGAIGVWDAASGKNLAMLSGHTERVYEADFSPDGTRIASCSNDNTVRLWDATSYEEVLELRGHTRFVHAARFSPDGRTLVSGSGDGTLRSW